MAQKESTLTTALAAAQARLTATASTNPIGLSEGLVRQTEFPPIDFATETSTAISNLEAAVIEYQSHEGQPNMPLIETRNEVIRLTAELEAAKKRLAEIEARGSFLDQLNQAVFVAERRVEGLVGHYERLVTDELIQARYGQSINFASLGSEAKRDLKFHVRITNPKRFHLGRRDNFEQIAPEYLYARAEKAAATLDALRAYIEQENAKK